jgi:phospholipid/cholesterol/gamma-HCH transport system ATP-binding protein
MIKVLDVHKSFGNKNVLSGVNLSVARGESMVVIGGSGSGKSVLLKNIIGLLKPDSGRVFINGSDITSLDEKGVYGIRKKFGMLFQSAALFDSMRVWENVAFVLLRRKMKVDDAKRIAIEKLEMVGLAGVEDIMPSELSGGMRKRVGLARAIAHQPEILLYDEPTTGLDPIMADAINDLIVEMNKKLAVTSVTITHDMHSAFKIADKIAMLYDGKIIFTGTIDDIARSNDRRLIDFVSGSGNSHLLSLRKGQETML